MSIRDDLKAYLDGELPEARMAEVRAALQADADLQREAEDLRMLGSAIRELSPEPCVVGLEQALRALEGQARWRPLGLPSRLIWVGGAACAVLLGLVMVSRWPATRQDDAAAATTIDKSAVAQARMPQESARFRAMSNSEAPISTQSAAPSGGADSGLAEGAVGADLEPEAKSQGLAVAPRAGLQGTTAPNSDGVGFVDSDVRLALRVPDPWSATNSVVSIAKSVGGVVRESLYDREIGGQVAVQVPAASFDALMRRLRALAIHRDETNAGEQSKLERRDKSRSNMVVVVTLSPLAGERAMPAAAAAEPAKK